MNLQSIKITTELNLCISCGVCKAVCPKKCISFQKINGMYQPSTNADECISCSLCKVVCPGLRHNYDEVNKGDKKKIIGNILDTYNAWSLDKDVRHHSASGGVVSTMVKQLLMNEIYDTAFCLDSYSYIEQLKTVPFTKDILLKENSFSNTLKSRYLAVSHESTVEYIKNNKEKRVIIIGTSCAIRGVENVINTLKLNRNNYLLIGLFCDKIFNYNINDYFSQKKYTNGQQLEQIHFKNKDSGGWPGNMKLIYKNGNYEYLDANERMKVKEIFMPERCLYCVDKLNVTADIAIGDNFTDVESSNLGSNSVIIRTDIGLNAWEKCKEYLAVVKVPKEKIVQSQALEKRLNNQSFALAKERDIKNNFSIDVSLNEGISKKVYLDKLEERYNNKLSIISLGANYKQKRVNYYLFKQKINTFWKMIIYYCKIIVRKIMI